MRLSDLVCLTVGWLLGRFLRIKTKGLWAAVRDGFGGPSGTGPR